MRVTPIRKTRESGDTNCPALYRTDDGGYVVVGRPVDLTDVDGGLRWGVGDGEIAIRVPADTLDG